MALQPSTISALLSALGQPQSVTNLINFIEAGGVEAIESLTGDVSATGPGDVPATVNSVGGSSASSINSAAVAIGTATSSPTSSTIVKRDVSGRFQAVDPVSNQDVATRAYVLANSGGSPNYGHAYGSSISQSVTIPFASTFVEVSAGLTGGLTNNFTFMNNHQLQCNSAGTYKVSFSMSVMSGTANEILEGAIMVNGTALLLATSDTEASVANHPGCVSASCIVTLANNDLVSLAVMNQTAAHNITLTQASLVVSTI